MTMGNNSMCEDAIVIVVAVAVETGKTHTCKAFNR